MLTYRLPTLRYGRLYSAREQKLMADTTRNQTDLIFFTHNIGGGTYGAWYRLLPADCIEVLGISDMLSVARGFAKTSQM